MKEVDQEAGLDFSFSFEDVCIFYMLIKRCWT
jgi:hypothetical protein